MSDRAIEVDLWGNEVSPFLSMRDKYGILPTTIWQCDNNDPMTRDLKELLQDGKTREDSFNTVGGSWNGVASESDRKIGASAFDPAVACWIFNCFGPKEGVVFDPFAGGGTRAIIAAKYGFQYIGVELREEQAEQVRERTRELGVDKLVAIKCGDATSLEIMRAFPDESADFLITCPPYYNLEKYDGGDRDLSMLDTYDEFLARLANTINETKRILRPGAAACWVVGMTRDKSGLLPLHHDIAALHKAAGFRMKEEVVLARNNWGAMLRMATFEKGNRYLIRMHEYCLVFTA